MMINIFVGSEPSSDVMFSRGYDHGHVAGGCYDFFLRHCLTRIFDEEMSLHFAAEWQFHPWNGMWMAISSMLRDI